MCDRPADALVASEGTVSRHVFSHAERKAIQDIADAAVRDVRVVLPALPKSLRLIVRPGKDVIAETGENATAVLPASVYWTFDPDRDVLSTIRAELRPTLFHEFHHLARMTHLPTRSLMDAVVTEGLATAFERDFGKANPPWGIAPPEATDWLRELLLQPEMAEREPWLFQHPDGRRWIGIRVGTFLVDRASKAAGRSAAEMVALPTDEILRLAEVR
jgi:hypothetical protein